MFENPQHELECRIQALVCGNLNPPEANELLARIARDEEARRVLDETLQDQQQARAAFGYDGAETVIEGSLQRVMTSLEAPEAGPEATPARASGRHWLSRLNRPSWWFRAAAAVVIVISAYVIFSARSANEVLQTHRNLSKDEVADLRQQMAALTERLAVPPVALTADDVARYREIWDNVTDDNNTWVLVSNGGGRFGKVGGRPAEGDGGPMLVVQCRVADQQGRWVYSADLLVPDRPMLKVRLPEAGMLADRPVALAVRTSRDRATVGLSLGSESDVPVRVAGEMPIDGTVSEIGQFRVGEETMRVCVRTRRVPGSRT